MSDTTPTLKIRLAIVDSALGMDCQQYAKKVLIGAPDGTEILDAKWGRPPQQWRSTGGGWGRPLLTDEERGYVAACNALAHEYTVEARLVAIIQRLTGTPDRQVSATEGERK